MKLCYLGLQFFSSPRTIDLASDIENLASRFQEIPQTIWVIAVILGFPLDHEDQSLLLKIPQTLNTGLRGTELELILSPLP